jgi:hypothetical protein
MVPLWNQLMAQVSEDRAEANRVRATGDWRRAKRLRCLASSHELRCVEAMEMLEEMRLEEAGVTV